MNPNLKISLEKSWNFNRQVLLLVVLGTIAILGSAILAWQIIRVSFSPPPSPQKISTPSPAAKIPETTEEIFKPGEVGETLKPGEVGEIPVSEKPKLPSGTQEPPGLPPIIFGTSGKIIEVKADRLIIAGSGSNFADRKPRNLTAIFTSSTITFEPGQEIKYQGLAGLEHLKVGMEISIEAEENIRGKTEFTARNINILPQ